MAKTTLREQLEDLQEAYDEMTADLRRVVDTTQRTHDIAHAGVIRFCPVGTCKLAVELMDSWSEVL